MIINFPRERAAQEPRGDTSMQKSFPLSVALPGSGPDHLSSLLQGNFHTERPFTDTLGPAWIGPVLTSPPWLSMD